MTLGDVFLRGWYIRWNGKGAYIGSKDGRKQAALVGLELLEKLLSLPNWEGLPTELLSLIGGSAKRPTVSHPGPARLIQAMKVTGR
jgi:hypothetical protein